MIPKIIHYCWMGKNPLNELALSCIASWKKYCPDYEIIEWNEDNFDINYCTYTTQAYQARKWAFVSDVVRLYAIVNYGGIYMDTDVEVLRPLDDLLNFPALSGFESDIHIPTGLMACEKGHPAFAEFLKEYDDIHFIKRNGTYNQKTNVARITNTCLKYGLKQDNTEQTLANGLHVMPKDYFCPKSYVTGTIDLTSNTYTIHHFAGSWTKDDTGESKYKSNIDRKLKTFHVPRQIRIWIENFFAALKFRGIKGAWRETWDWVLRKLRLREEEK